MHNLFANFVKILEIYKSFVEKKFQDSMNVAV